MARNGRREIYMKGFFGRLLRIDCSRKSFSYEPIPDATLRETLGGKGLGTRILIEENPPGVNPLAPENIFVIAVGPVTGTRIWSQSRFAVFSKSPATGGYAESYCGGTLAPKIKGCGVDAVVITGKCDDLSYIAVNEDTVAFHDAAEIAGADCYDAEDYIVDHSGEGAGAMVIGPAGENMVGFSCIKSDRYRSLGRGGMGAILGSKRVKGISFAGKAKAPVADEELVKQIIKEVGRNGRTPTAAVYQQVGTPAQVAVTNTQECFPTRYWKSGRFEKWRDLSGDYLLRNFEVKKHGCPNCFLQCTKQTTVKNGRHAGLVVDGPEFETIYALGGLNCIDTLEEVAYLNDVCDRLGLDTMSAGNVSAFAIEARARGKLSFDIGYNQPDRVAELFRLIAHREGVGDLLADGVKSASEALGLEEIAVHVKGLEPAGFDPRVLKGMGLSYATAARGACHLRGTFYKAELSGEVDKDVIPGKAIKHIDYEDRATIFDSLILCRFFRDFILWDELSLIIKGTTGLEFSKEDLEVLANRITMDSRRYNTREGIGPDKDTLPRALMVKNDEGHELAEEDLRAMVDEYNAVRESRLKNASRRRGP